MDKDKEYLHVTHVNIRLSISLLLSKLILIELVVAIFVFLLHTSFFLFGTEYLEGLGLELLNIPVYGLLILIKLLITIPIVLQWLNEYYEITPTTIYYRKGIFFKTEEKHLLKDVAELKINQGVAGKIFNYATISLSDRRRKSILVMNYIHNPMRYAAILSTLTPEASEVKHTLRDHIREHNIYERDNEK